MNATRILFALTVSLMTCVSFSAGAADLRVRVFERGGNVPLEGVSVCLGTQARLDQFGASRTDDEGYAVFSELPQAQIIVTASRDGYKSEQESLVTSNLNRLLVLSLSAGGGGVDCRIDSASVELSAAGLAVRRFTINKGQKVTDSRTVSLHNSVTGTATQYRASERRDMQGAEWQYYSAAPEFTLSEGTGLKRVYLQVRRHSTVNGATLETVSPVVQDSITLR